MSKRALVTGITGQDRPNLAEWLLRSAAKYTAPSVGRNSEAMRLVFFHIPKCGGTSVIRSIKKAYLPLWYPAVNRLIKRPPIFNVDTSYSLETARAFGIDFLDLRRTLLFYQLCNTDSGFISGHYPFSKAVAETFRDQWHFVVVLRHPVERFFSAYFFNRYKKAGDHFRVTDDIDTHINSAQAVQDASALTAFLTERKSTDGLPHKDEVEQAILNLNYFSVVGFLDNMNAFADKMEAHFGKRPRIEHRNRNPARQDIIRQGVNADIRRKVIKLCSGDIELYERARSMFG